MLDSQSEGFEDIVKDVVTETNAFERLQKFLSLTLDYLGIHSEKEHFYLYPQETKVDALNNITFDGPPIHLSKYLDALEKRSNDIPDISSCFTCKDKMGHWLKKNQILLKEMSRFLFWLVKHLRQNPSSVPIILLRDTLLIYFGMQWLRNLGLKIPEPQATFISRKFLQSFEGDQVYSKLAGNTYKALDLLESEEINIGTFRNAFVSLSRPIIETNLQLAKASLSCVNIQSGNEPFIVESGFHGTFPLWIIALLKNKGNFFMYCSAPWLHNTFKEITFQSNYNYLTDMEAITIHDNLFQFDSVSTLNKEIFVRETTNKIAQNLSFYELYTFKKLVIKNAKEVL